MSYRIKKSNHGLKSLDYHHGLHGSTPNSSFNQSVLNEHFFEHFVLSKKNHNMS